MGLLDLVIRYDGKCRNKALLIRTDDTTNTCYLNNYEIEKNLNSFFLCNIKVMNVSQVLSINYNSPETITLRSCNTSLAMQCHYNVRSFTYLFCYI